MQRFILALTLAFGIVAAADATADDEAYQRLFHAQLAIAQKGDPKGMYYLAQMYDNGLGTTPDHDKAMEWYQKAADQGNPLAKRRLAEAAKHQQIAKLREDSEREAERARRRAADEASRAAKAAELAKKQTTDEDAQRAAKAAEAARKKAEQEAAAANQRLALAEAERKTIQEREVARRAAFKKAWEAEVKRAKAAAHAIE